MSDLALKSSQEQIATFKRLYGGKEVFVTETGWPSSSAPYEHHRGSLEVQQLYLQVRQHCCPYCERWILEIHWLGGWNGAEIFLV